jgi:hypothetical protein
MIGKPARNPVQDLYQDSGQRSRSILLAAGASSLLALLAPLALILAGHNAGRAAWDSTVYHEPFIRQLARSFPAFDLSDPLTATTPGYHLLLALIAHLGADQTAVLRIVSALIGAALSGVLAGWIARRTPPIDAILLTLPLAFCIYTVSSSAWLLPDNLAWIGVMLVLFCCLCPSPAWRPLIVAAALLAALVFTRQIHIWAAAPIWLAAWMGAQGHQPRLFDRIPLRAGRAGIALLLTLPAFAIVAWFVSLWNGPTPPRFQNDITGINPATPAFILLQISILMLGFGPWLLPPTLRTLRDHPKTLLAAAMIGAALAIGPTTTLDQDAGRYSGWWVLAGKAPVLFGRTSTASLALAPLGAVLLAGALREAPHRARWILLGALVAFAAAQSSTINSWQRYHEPFLIILLAMLAASQPKDLAATPLARLRLPAMLTLSGTLALVTLNGMRGTNVAPGTTPPPVHTQPTDPWHQPEPTPAAEQAADPHG